LDQLIPEIQLQNVHGKETIKMEQKEEENVVIGLTIA